MDVLISSFISLLLGIKSVSNGMQLFFEKVSGHAYS